MKMLVVGIDGADPTLFGKLNMPFFKELSASAVQPKLTEDLWSRGWAEIVSGAHGRDTGAFYYRPAKYGSHDFTQSYRLADFAESSQALPLWSMLAERGVRAGFMNIPTTFPAPHIDGFFVSGAGSGVGGSGGAEIPSGAVSPKALEETLKYEKYIFDLRLWASNIDDLGKFIEAQVEMTERRTAAFLTACKKERPTFGFLAYMMTKYLFNLSMFELQSYIDNDCVALNNDQERLVEAFSALDSCIARLFEALQPERYMLVSDHGSVPYRKRVDMNIFLREAGFQKRGSVEVSMANSARKMARRLVPLGLRKRVNRNLPSTIQAKIASHGVDLERAEAFAARYVPGVYLNDRRFGGPLNDAAAPNMVDEICNRFNSLDIARENNLRARPYRTTFSSAQFEWMLPDVWIDHPDTFFFEHGIGEGAPSGGRFISPNAAYGPLPPLNQVSRDLWTGIKGRHPLFVIDQATAAQITKDDPKDLRLAHHLIERNFS